MIGNVYFENILPHVLGHISSAKKSLKVAVSWLTDKEIFNLLMQKLADGVSVSIVTRNDYLNNHPEALPWDNFIEAGGKLYFSRNGEQLHYKFILADDAAVLCTSYNLTCFANGNNRENVMLFADAAFVANFAGEFDYLVSTLVPQTQITRVRLEDTPAELHGFNTATVANDRAKQRV